MYKRIKKATENIQLFSVAFFNLWNQKIVLIIFTSEFIIFDNVK